MKRRLVALVLAVSFIFSMTYGISYVAASDIVMYSENFTGDTTTFVNKKCVDGWYFSGKTDTSNVLNSSVQIATENGNSFIKLSKTAAQTATLSKYLTGANAAEYNTDLDNADKYVIKFKFKTNHTGSTFSLMYGSLYTVTAPSSGKYQVQATLDATSTSTKTTYNGTFDFSSDWNDFAFYVDKTAQTTDLYINDTEIFKDVPKISSYAWSNIQFSLNNALRGDIMLDDLEVLVEEPEATYTGDANSRFYDFEDFTVGKLISGTGDFIYSAKPDQGGYAYIENSNDNTYLALRKTVSQVGAYSMVKDLTEVNKAWNNYVTEIKFMIDETNAYAYSTYSVTEAGDGGKGLTINLGKSNNTLKIIKDATTNYFEVSNAFNSNEFNTLKMVMNRRNKTSDVYVNDNLIMKDIPSRTPDYDYGKLTFTVNNSCTGGILIDDISTYCVEDKISSDVVRINDDTISGWKGYDVSTIKDVISYDEDVTSLTVYDGEIEITSGELAENMTMVIVGQNNYAKTYVFTKADNVFDISYTNNGYSTNNRFQTGEIKAKLNVECNLLEAPVLFAIAKYENGILTEIKATHTVYTESEKTELTLTTENTENTYIKIFALDGTTMMPLVNAVTLLPYSSEDNAVVEAEYYPGFLTKAVTISYDDGLKQYDRDLIAVLNEKNLTATFNIIGSHLSESYYSSTEEWETEIEDYKQLYKNFEVSNHSYSHPEMRITDPTNAGYISDEDAIKNIDDGKAIIDNVFGENSAEGFVWPYSRADRAEILDHINNNYIYARNSAVNHSYELPENFLEWEFTVMDSSEEKYYDQFINDSEKELELFSIWGHAKQLINPDGAYAMTLHGFADGLLSRIDGDRDMLYIATCKDIVNYVNTLRNNIVVDNKTVTNTGDVTVYLRINGENVTIAPQSQYTVD